MAHSGALTRSGVQVHDGRAVALKGALLSTALVRMSAAFSAVGTRITFTLPAMRNSRILSTLRSMWAWPRRWAQTCQGAAVAAQIGSVAQVPMPKQAQVPLVLGS